MNNVLYSKAIFFRNLKDYKFVPKLTKEKQNEIIEKLSQILPNFKLVSANTIDEKTVKILNKNSLKISNKSLLLDEKNGVVVYLFEGEHVEICATSQEANKAYKKIKEVSDLIANNISLSYADNYGYLMSDVTKIGSGLKLTSEICMPSIVELGKVEQIKQNLKKLGYELIQTNLKYVFELSTMCNLGIKEKDIVDDFEKILNNLQEIELESAKMLDVGSHDEIVDKTVRSLAILKSAYLLTTGELHSLLTNVRTGLNLQIIDVDISKVDKLQTLVCNKNMEFTSQTELKKLAEKVKDVLKGE